MRLAITLGLLLLAGSLPAQGGRGGIIKEANLKRYRQKAEKARAKDLTERFALAKWGLQRGFIDDGQDILAAIIQRHPDHEEAVAALKTEWEEPDEIPAKLQKTWQKRRSVWRRQATQRALSLAKWCRSKKLPIQAEAEYERVLEIDAENAQARKALGFVRHNGKWETAEDAKLLKQGYVLHEDIAWIPQEAAEALERGEYPVGGTFVALKKADELCSQWDRAWHLRSRHFDLTSNKTLADVLSILRRLELGRRVCREVWGMRVLPEGEKGPVPVFWSLTWERFQVLVGDVDVSGGTNHYREGNIWTCGDSEGGGIDETPRKVYEYAVEHVTDSHIDKVRDTVGCWVFYAAGSSTAFFDVDDKGELTMQVGTIQSRYKFDGAKLVNKYGPKLLARINDSKAEAWKPEFYAWWNTGILFLAHLYSVDDGRWREPLKRFVRTASQGRATPKLFEKVFGRKIESFHESFAAFVGAK